MGKGSGLGGGGGGRRKSKEEKAMEVEQKRMKRELKRAELRSQEQHKVKDLDVLGMARHELGLKQPDADSTVHTGTGTMNWKHGEGQGSDQGSQAGAAEEEDDGGGGFLALMKWLYARPKAPPKEWETFRKDEIDQYVDGRRASIIGRLWTERFYFNQVKNMKLRYWGDRDIFQQREGRGICFWPDPPKGGGESYFGLWRADLPNGHGVFRWFTGDVYMGQWSMGLEQGFGVYRYGPYGEFGGDRYEGMYFAGNRQGTGSYTYAGGVDEDGQIMPGGIFLGDWLKGRMHGKGILAYTDGEYFIGNWKHDKKDGLGTYMWGTSSGDVAGDKFEGHFKNGNCDGYGRTLFNDGGWHKGSYRNGKMHGSGVMQTSDGWEYSGNWSKDELHGEVVCTNVFGFNAQKQVHRYDYGTFVGSRAFDIARDWSQIEALGLEAARYAETAAEEARSQSAEVTNAAKRAKQSQLLARDAMDEAIYYLKACVAYKAYLLQWMGLRQYLVPSDA